tara:strand:- start:76 stop:1125 length:1050 start_codon:yes stop_codon:yes gene_type:complete
MKLLVTGGCGFIGSNFIIERVLKGRCTILNIDSLSYAANPANLKSLSQNKSYQFVKGDINDSALILDCLNSFKPNVIVNFAAETHVDRSIDNPDNFIKTNILGTANLLKCAYQYYNSDNSTAEFKFLHISTDEVYGSLDNTGYFYENTPYAPNSPYSASKASSDHLVNAWFKTYGLPTLISNCSNNYGPYQFPEKLIPLLIANCFDQKDLPIYGDGSNIRDWLYVEDHCSAINSIILHGAIGNSYNVGGNNEMTNLEIVNTVCDILDKLKPRDQNKSYRKLIKFVEDRPGHDFRYAVNTDKINSHTGWSPQYNFPEAIENTIKWYIDNESWWRKIQLNNYQQQRMGVVK